MPFKISVILIAITTVIVSLTAVPAGASTIHHTNANWYLAANRACYTQTDYYTDGNTNLQTWCYNDAGTVLEGVQNLWFPDFFHVSAISPGTGKGTFGASFTICTDFYPSHTGTGWWPNNHFRPNPNIGVAAKTGGGKLLWFFNTTSWWAVGSVWSSQGSSNYLTMTNDNCVQTYIH